MSAPPPQKVMSFPKSRLSRHGSMSLALIWTGLMMSTPASIRSGSSLWIEPHECRNVFIAVCSCT